MLVCLDSIAVLFPSRIGNLCVRRMGMLVWTEAPSPIRLAGEDLPIRWDFWSSRSMRGSLSGSCDGDGERLEVPAK